MKITPITTSSGLRIGSREPMRYKLSRHEFNIQSALISSLEKQPRWKSAINAIWRWL